MSWRLAKGLAKLREQINQQWPNRSRVSDGTIGDAAHASRASDHNPWLKIKNVGVVTAFDITKDDQNGPDAYDLAQALTQDKRTKYVIFNSRIWKARTGKWEAYTGVNAHKSHVHVSIKPESADDDRPWELAIEQPPVKRPTLKVGAEGQPVRVMQERLRAHGYSLAVDGMFGRVTESVVKQFQRRENLTADGICGERTWQALVQDNGAGRTR